MNKIAILLTLFLLGCASVYTQNTLSPPKKKEPQKTEKRKTTNKKAGKKKTNKIKKAYSLETVPQQPSLKTSPIDTPKDEVIIGKMVSGSLNGHDWVDLGLPSGLKWATCNVGADAPHDYGDYYAYGETEPKQSYTAENSDTHGMDVFSLNINGISDESGTLFPKYDVAFQEWGDGWRMPTQNEIKELVLNTIVEWCEIEGIAGVIVKSKNGKGCMFLPAGGVLGKDAFPIAVGEYGYYRSSTPDEMNGTGAYSLYFDSSQFLCDWSLRCLGRLVRPVTNGLDK